MLSELILVETPVGKELLSNILKGKISKDPAFDELSKRYSWDDIGSGNLFADCYKSSVRYVAERGKWYYYSAGRWEPDNGFVMELCKQLGTALMQFWMQTNDDEEANSFECFKNMHSGGADAVCGKRFLRMPPASIPYLCLTSIAIPICLIV